jgi:hypothetical protein
VDIFIIGNPDLTELNETIVGLEEQLDREINYMSFDREEFEMRKKNKELLSWK